jgi:WD40 repeat protein
MNCQRGLWAGISVLLILTGCSKDKTLNVEGAYTPVITNLASDHEPPVRGAVNAITALVYNPRGYTVQYHWSTTSGGLTDSTAQTAHWTPPNAIGVYPVTVSIQAHDPTNNADFFKTRTFLLSVDNEFERWTRSVAVQFDVVPPAGGKIYYSEVRNSGTGESDVWALASAMGTPEQITRDFWQATSPTAQSDGSRIAFLGRVRASDGGASLWQVPPSGGDTISSSVLVRWNNNTNHFIGPPRFAPSGSMIAYSNDTLSSNFGRPKPWLRDAANLGIQPIPMAPNTANPDSAAFSSEVLNSYWNGAWSGLGDSIVFESYSVFAAAPSGRLSRGLFKLSASGNAPANPEPFPVWLDDVGAMEPDWSPDGQRIVFVKRMPGRTDRDIWLMNAHASDISSAVHVTSGIADEFHPRFSSDGLKIFFVSNRIDGYGANGFFDTERRGFNIWSVARFDLP